MRPLPTANMFVGDTRDLRVGLNRQDDYDLDEMLGTDTDFYDQLPVSDFKEYGQDDLLEMRRRSHAHHLKTAFTGIVRGSIRANELRFEGPWVRITELLTVFNQHTKSRWGVHEVLALICQDNKQRFLIAGSEQDPRAEYYRQPVYPLWVRAAHGHNVRLELDDKDIAVRWFTLVPKEQGPLAPTKGGRVPLMKTFRQGSITERWRTLPSRSLTANSLQATGRAGRCTITSAVCQSRTCPIKPEPARICRSRSCLRLLLFSDTLTSLKRQVNAFSAGRKCRGVRSSTFVTPSRIRSCTPGPLRRLHLTLQNVWKTLARRKWWCKYGFGSHP